ncbi:hypothetical protein ABI59_23645 [Acidobacteria bacterium Mor1]|nr:hypothetical protein ABI59_23645 [Acidobacteria bacterium Mor1]
MSERLRHRRRLRPLHGALAVLLSLASVAALAHGASRGLHLHLTPDPARPGSTLTVEVEASEPVLRVSAGLGEQRLEPREFDPPRRKFELELKVPADPGAETLNAFAEVRTTSGKTLRASAVLRILAKKERPKP